MGRVEAFTRVHREPGDKMGAGDAWASMDMARCDRRPAPTALPHSLHQTAAAALAPRRETDCSLRTSFSALRAHFHQGHAKRAYDFVAWMSDGPSGRPAQSMPYCCSACKNWTPIDTRIVVVARKKRESGVRCVSALDVARGRE